MANITTSADYNYADVCFIEGAATGKFTEIITKYEKIILKALFGYTMYKDFIANPTEDKYIRLISGVEFTNSEGELDKFDGLKYVLVGLITFFGLRWANSKQTANGRVKPDPENGVNVDNVTDMVQAWNEGIDHVLICYDYIIQNPTDYPDFDFEDEYFDYLDQF